MAHAHKTVQDFCYKYCKNIPIGFVAGYQLTLKTMFNTLL